MSPHPQGQDQSPHRFGKGKDLERKFVTLASTLMRETLPCCWQNTSGSAGTARACKASSKAVPREPGWGSPPQR